MFGMPSPKHILLPLILAVGISVEITSLALEGATPQKAVPAPVRKVAVIADSTLDAPARYGVRKLVDALRAKGVAVSSSMPQLFSQS